ncbi:polysaccharide deacetylase family protein [Fredinandcohnia onubensis]|uniref:polysaccharide deacetylase family protein n=1 Tax=Fredinandcohnia onubensis TaxID=1571209 RepID=UPI000C0BE392|nr:polysaccharide deacetylase family protein [Fredinandcohnia onubensis]
MIQRVILFSIICSAFLLASCSSKEMKEVGGVAYGNHNIEQKEETIPNARFSVDRSWKNEYLLEIKGESPYLEKKTVTSMQKWREEIIEFSKTQENVYINGPNKKQVSLTFDDGPDSTVTSAVIGVLDQYGVKGNFFFLGSEAEKHPEVVKEAYEKGHLVLSHSYHHVQLDKLSEPEVRNEIEQAGTAIEEIIGQAPALVRTPYGSTNELVAEVAKGNNVSIILWSIDSLDWAQRSTDVISSNVLSNIRNGDIILMHTDADEYDTYEVLPSIIEELQEQGYEIVDLETLLGLPAYQ